MLNFSKIDTIPLFRWYSVNKDSYEIGKVYNSKRRKIIHKPKTKYSETLKELILKTL